MKQNERLPSLVDDSREVAPIWGHPLRMLVHGYDWKGAPGYTPRNWKPRKVWVTEYIERVCYPEPEPRVSNKSTTGKVVHYMVRGGWSAEQIHHELNLPENVGGAYYRWRCNTDEDGGEAFLSAMVAGSYPEQAVEAWREDQYSRGVSAGLDERFLPKPKSRARQHTQPDNTESVLSGRPGQCWKTVATTPVLKKTAAQLLRHLQVNGPQSLSECKDTSPMRANYVQAYIHALEEVGMVTTAMEKHRTRDGKWRRCRVLRVASPEAVRAALSAPSTAEADRDLWRILKPAHTPQTAHTVVTLDDLVRTPVGVAERLTLQDIRTLAQPQGGSSEEPWSPRTDRSELRWSAPSH